MLKSLVTVLFLFLSSNLLAATPDAHIVKLQGTVYVLHNQGGETRVDKPGYLVNRLDTVLTREGGRAVLKFNDGTVSVLDEKSSLRIEKSGWISQLGGKVYYLFSKLVGAKRSKTVTTSFATIGIRGTEFIVNVENDNDTIVLKKGHLKVAAPEGEYEIHHKTLDSDNFDLYREQQWSGVNEYLKEFDGYRDNLNAEFIEYRKELSMGAGQVVRFAGNRVDSMQLTDRLNNEFLDMHDFAAPFITEENGPDLNDHTGFK
ncbi:MAG: FecR family protein [Gammaproteobacteria bacterium]|nr:FecR family protein [Gammaproteobacteria bacterium]